MPGGAAAPHEPGVQPHQQHHAVWRQVRQSPALQGPGWASRKTFPYLPSVVCFCSGLRTDTCGGGAIQLTVQGFTVPPRVWGPHWCRVRAGQGPVSSADVRRGDGTIHGRHPALTRYARRMWFITQTHFTASLLVYPNVLSCNSNYGSPSPPPDRPWLTDILQIQRLQERVYVALQYSLHQSGATEEKLAKVRQLGCLYIMLIIIIWNVVL